MTAQLAGLVRQSKVLLLDFDGPVCDLFAGHPESLIAGQAARYLADQGVDLPSQFDDPGEPLKLLTWVGANAAQHTAAVEDLVIAGEVTATATATPTPHAAEVIAAAHRTGRPVAIVTNNAEAAIARYLELHDLSGLVTLVAGRAYARPEKMKPHPSPVLRAVDGLGVAPEDCVLVGDLPTDIQACHGAGVPAVGYAKNEERGQALTEAGAEQVIDTMADLLAAVEAP